MKTDLSQFCFKQLFNFFLSRLSFIYLLVIIIELFRNSVEYQGHIGQGPFLAWTVCHKCLEYMIHMLSLNPPYIPTYVELIHKITHNELY